MNCSLQKLIGYLLLLFILGDLAYSFWQYLHFPIDEDLAHIVLPDPFYQKVLDDPLGWEVWQTGEGYKATNRFAAHYAVRAYFRVMPHWLQNFLSPMDSLYWSSAIFKLLVQLLLLAQLSRYTLAVFRDTKIERLAVFAFILPFFQTMGYQHVFGIIDPSITYTFFYAWPMALLLVFYWPFFKKWMQLPNRHQPVWSKLLSLFLALVLPFASPLAAPLILIISLLYFTSQVSFLARYGFRQKAWSELVAKGGFAMFVVILVTCTALYSYVLGTYNIENQLAGYKAISERYQLMPHGFWHHLKAKLAYPLLILTLLANAFILKRSGEHYSEHWLRLALPYFIAGVLLYLILLPLGGYRDYRPDIVRRDTLLPVLLALLMWLGWSSVAIAKLLQGKKRIVYITFLVLIGLTFTLADGPNASLNDCERQGLETLSKAKTSPVVLSGDCPVLAWQVYNDPASSRWNAYFLRQLGITDQVILYSNE